MKKTLLIAIIALIVLAFVISGTMIFKNSKEDRSISIVERYSNEPAFAKNGLRLILSDDQSYYSVTDIGECTDSDVVIPSHHNGIPVTHIEGKAFINKELITSVSIPDTVTEIGFNAFYGCENLKFEFYENGSYLGNSSNPYAFLITFDENYEGAAVIHEDTKVLANNSFYQNKNITSVEFPEGLTVIGNRAFLRCVNLKSVSIPNSVKYIGDEAFWSCKAITNVYIGSGVEYIGNSAFCSCNALTSLHIANGVKMIGPLAFFSCDSLSKVEIPESVTVIEDSAFYGCKALEDVTLHSGIRVIGQGAFYGIKARTYNKHGSVYYLGNSNEPYLYAVNITKDVEDTITFHQGMAGISQKLLYNISPESIQIDANGNVGKYLRSESNCIIRNSDSSIICGANVRGIPEGVTSIDDYAFSDATVAEEITLPASLEKIGVSSFEACKILRKVTFLGANTELSKTAFENCKELETVVLPGALSEIPQSCFFGCNALVDITIPESVKYLGPSCLNYCESLTEIDLPGVVVIEHGAFSNCASLKSVTFSDSLLFIGSMAFSNCASLESVQFPENIEYIASIAFSSTGLTSFAHPDNVGNFSLCAVSHSNKLVSLKIQEGATELERGYLKDCPSLKEIRLPSTLTALNSVALFDLPALEKLHYSGTVAEWNALEKSEKWYVGTPAFTVVCSDGEVEYPAVENDGSGYDITID